MKVHQYEITDLKEVHLTSNNKADLVLVFGSKLLLQDDTVIHKISQAYTKATIAYCSSAGEIYNDEVRDNTISMVAVEFASVTLKSNAIKIDDFTDSFEAGKALVSGFDQSGLKYILILSDGSKVNGSELVKGMNSVIPEEIPITGGLAGDGATFVSTLTGLNEKPLSGRVLAIGFYGEHLKVSHGSMGGWETFGLEKTVTKSQANELCEIDNKSALEMYKEYLGKYAAELPGSALLFPLAVRINDEEDAVVRTILSINNEKNSMIFAGDVPVGSKVRFMKANFDRLIDAASTAAKSTLVELHNSKPQLALLISCVGRKLILGNRIDEEVEAIKDIFQEGTVLTGFYSYGEISPMNPGAACKLHNQTMTITCLEES
ncbi:MAG: FIST C-terminal domain-containing protein [Saprospiraceae bacterium]|nr:FIST C-terminal domain-containing protein [Saprospiraceae bacterium]